MAVPRAWTAMRGQTPAPARGGWRRHRWRPGAPTAGGHHDHLVGLQRHGDFVQHADHGLALRHQRAHQRQPVGLVRRVQVGQGLVHQQHLRLHGQRAASSTRWRSPPDSSPRRRSRQSQACVARNACSTPRGRPPGRGQPGLVRQAAQHGHVPGRQVVGARFRSGPARTAPRALAPRQSRQRLAQQLHLPHWWGSRPASGLEQRGLAGAIGADDAGPAAGRQAAMPCSTSAFAQAVALHFLPRAACVKRYRIHKHPAPQVRRCISHSR
jgi:hypothetical protein